MICTVIQNKNYDEIQALLAQCEMAEIRLDNCDVTLAEIGEIFTSDVPLVATCRLSDVNDVKETTTAQKRLIAAIEAGARYVDVEMGAPKYMSKTIRAAAHDNAVIFIRSVHDYEGTPSEEELRKMYDKCIYHGADMVKFVTTAKDAEDVARLFSLYDYAEKSDAGAQSGAHDLIAFCMGDAGKTSRYECLLKGAPYTYAAVSEDDIAAPGQMSTAAMRKKIYGDFEFYENYGVNMPCSKSFAQRAIVAAAMAGGESVLRGYTSCGDNEAAIELVKSLGAKVSYDTDSENDSMTLRIKGIGASVGSVEAKHVHVGESGLLARLMIPLMSQISSVETEITGEKTLCNRPMKGAGVIMNSFGVNVPEDCTVPIKVKGPLGTGKVEVSGAGGSQLISGLLMASPLSQKNTTISVEDPKSIPYMFISLDVLKKFGIKITNDMLGGQDFIESGGDWGLCTELVFKVKGGQFYRAAELDLEGDWSAAANFLVAGAIFGRVEINGLDTTSLQADLSIMDILMDAGASMSQLDGDDGLIAVQRAPLYSFEADLCNCPDLFPIVSVLAAFCRGTSRLSGLSRLKHKESDRGAAILDMLTKFGVKVVVEDDDLVIEGESLANRLLSGHMLHGGSFSSYHDHRMVMALAVAALGADSAVEIDDEECVTKSFPDFLNTI